MKRLALVLLLASIASLAATAALAGVEFGIKAGVTGSNLRGDIRQVTDPVANIEVTGGVSLAVPVVKNLLAIQGEALYVMKGADLPQGNNLDGSVAYAGGQKLDLSYIEVPVVARFDVPAGLPFTPFVLAGPSFGYNLQAKVKSDDPSQPTISVSGVRKLDTGLAMGVGLRIPIAGFKVTAEGRYTPSLQDVQTDANAAIPARNSVFTFMAGLVF